MSDPSYVIVSYDAATWAFLSLLIAYLAFVALGLGFGFHGDNLLWLAVGFIPAGMIMIGLSFQAWAVSSSFFASISLAMLGIVTMVYPIVALLRKMIT